MRLVYNQLQYDEALTYIDQNNKSLYRPAKVILDELIDRIKEDAAEGVLDYGYIASGGFAITGCYKSDPVVLSINVDPSVGHKLGVWQWAEEEIDA